MRHIVKAPYIYKEENVFKTIRIKERYFSAENNLTLFVPTQNNKGVKKLGNIQYMPQ